MMRSIRGRLLLWVVGGMAVLLTLFSVVVYHVLRTSLESGFDAVLASTVQTITGSVEQADGEIKAEIDEHQMPEFSRPQRPDYYQLWREDGRQVLSSPSIRDVALQRFTGPPGTLVFRSALLPDGRPGRVVSFSFVPKVEDETRETTPRRSATLVVARDTATLDAEIAFLRWLLAAASGGAVVLAFLVSAIVVRQGLKPVDDLASRIAAIRHDDLSTQISRDRLPSEMAPVADRLNSLLRRLEEAFRREKAFTADVAHELRTPLAGMRCALEVALTRQRPDDDYRQTMTECLGIIHQTQAMVDSLLILARLEEGRQALHPETIHLGKLIETTWQSLATDADARGIDFQSRVPAGLACQADLDTLKIILANLLMNASEYTNDGGTITLTVGSADGRIALTIANTGCGLSPEDTRRVFERFWRGDAARSNTGVHCGLGLALVHRAVAALSGVIEADTRDGCFTVRLAFPASN